MLKIIEILEIIIIILIGVAYITLAERKVLGIKNSNSNNYLRIRSNAKKKRS